MDRDRLPADTMLAATRIAPYVRETPLDYSPFFSERCGANVWLKLENLQYTGSFKLRGACNKLLSMTPEERRAGVVAASSGNHGAAVAHAMATLGVDGRVFVPERSSTVKVEAIRRAGVEVRHFGEDGLETELHARAHAERHGMHYLSPYNDAAIIAGQGTCGVEIGRRLEDVDAVFIAVGGGGLLAGVGAFLKATNPRVAVVACQPEASPVMTESVRAGRIVELPARPTLSDGTAGGIEADAITFALCRELATEYVVVPEDDIAQAMSDFIDAHHMLAEGAAGVALAALTRARGDYRDANVAVIVCGGNVARDTLRAVI